MIKIYHNPRCSKSRQGVAILEEAGVTFDIVKYLDTPFNKEELSAIIAKLGISPLDLVRKNEAIWKSNYKGKDLSDAEILEAMLSHPRLIERPIVVHGDKAVIGRPPENIKEII